MRPRILAVDNDPQMVELLARQFEREGWNAVTALGGAEAIAALARHEFAVILSDLVMEEIDGLAVLREAQRLQPAARVILMTAFGSLESAIEAIRAGAYDYITKPFRLAEVTLAVQRALADQRIREENRRLRAELDGRPRLDHVVGRSTAMAPVFEKIAAVAETDATILLLGESGTGKELVARAIHSQSLRREGPFVAVNCAAIPETLLESELFGHEKGAFTGADRRRRGLFLEASGGTLFLDEIAEMPSLLQVKLLRAIQDKAVRPIGGTEEIRLDIRLMAATNRDLPVLVREGKFREDLYYRLAVIPLRLPSLRERADDIPLLAARFLERVAATLGKRVDGFTEDAMAALVERRWPGNVRELENVIERAAILARGALITLDDIQSELMDADPSEPGLRPTLAELERRYMQRVLEETKGDKNAAARVLGVSVRTLQRRARELML
jgi:two-component system response regulator HydG